MRRARSSRPPRGLFVRRSWWEGLGFSEQTLAIMRAVQRPHPDWVFCGPSAALALGCDVPYAWQRPLHVLRESGNASARTALVTHHSTTLADDARERPIWHGGLHVTPLLRTVLDSLRWMSFREGMVVADWAMGACGVACRTSSNTPTAGSAPVATPSAPCRRSSVPPPRRERRRVDRPGRDDRAGLPAPAQQVEVPRPAASGADVPRGLRLGAHRRTRDRGRVRRPCASCSIPRWRGDARRQQVLLDQRKREGLITAYDVSVLRFTYEEAARGDRARPEARALRRAARGLAAPRPPVRCRCRTGAPCCDGSAPDSLRLVTVLGQKTLPNAMWRLAHCGW